eukprot:114421_1
MVTMALLCLFLHVFIGLCALSKGYGKINYNINVGPLHHAVQSGVYAIAGPSYPDGESTLVKYDTTTGNASTVIIPNTRRPPITEEDLSCFDNINHIVLLIYEHLTVHGYVTALYPFDLQNTTAQYDPIVLPIESNPLLAGDQCASDPSTGDVYIFGHDASNHLYQLLLKLSFDPKKKHYSITQIGNYSLIDDIPLVSGELSTYDSKRDMLWLTGEYGKDDNDSTSDYFYINAKTGEVENKMEWDGHSGVYNPHLDQIVGVTSTRWNEMGYAEYQLVYTDPKTLDTVKSFAAFTGVDWCLYNDVYTMDIEGGIFYQIVFANVSGTCVNSTHFAGHLVGVDIYHGTVVTSPQICELGDIDSCPWSIQYWDGR